MVTLAVTSVVTHSVTCSSQANTRVLTSSKLALSPTVYLLGVGSDVDGYKHRNLGGNSTRDIGGNA